MNNIKDLHFREQVFPMFDYVVNEFSRDRLIELFSTMPHSIDEVYARQDILKGLLKHPVLFKPPVYSLAEFIEVYEGTMDNKNRRILLEEYYFAFYIPFTTIRRRQEESKVILIISFLKRIYDAYFSELDVSLFPGTFREELAAAKNLLFSLEVEKIEVSSRKRPFNTRQLIAKIKMLDERVRDGKMLRFWSTFFSFEAYLSIAKGIRRYGLVFPEFTNARLRIENFYHPLVKNPVKNSIEVIANVTVLTGPNMSGKSTLLKSLGLCVYLGRLGVGVPADKCEMLFYDSISVAIGLEDDIQNGYSHFKTELSILKRVVSGAANGKRCFAVFDELFRGTNSDDALSVSEITINGLAKYDGSCFFISTHLHQLKDKISATSSVDTRQVECKLLNDQPVFTYKLQSGWSDLKIGQILFEKEGILMLFNPGSKM